MPKTKPKYTTRTVLKLTQKQKDYFHDKKYYIVIRRQLNTLIKKEEELNK